MLTLSDTHSVGKSSGCCSIMVKLGDSFLNLLSSDYTNVRNKHINCDSISRCYCSLYSGFPNKIYHVIHALTSHVVVLRSEAIGCLRCKGFVSL